MISLVNRSTGQPIFTYDENKHTVEIQSPLLKRLFDKGISVPAYLEEQFPNKEVIKSSDADDCYRFFKDHYTKREMASTINQYEWREIPDASNSKKSTEKANNASKTIKK